MKKEKVRKRQIANMLGSSKQAMVLSIKNLEILLCSMPNSVEELREKRRKIFHKREALKKELSHFEHSMKGVGAKIEKYKQPQAVYEFFKVMKSLRRVQRFIDETANLKYDAHLRNFGEEFEQAKLRIKDCTTEKKALKKKAKKYSTLFDMPVEEIKAHGIRPEKLI